MNVDIYKIKESKGYVFVEAGMDVTKIGIEADIEVIPFKIGKGILSRPGFIGENPEEIILEIQENGYSIKGAEIIFTENT